MIDLGATRRKLQRAEAVPGRLGQVWRAVRRLARAHPDRTPWLTPFVAVMDNDPALIAHARRGIADYLRGAAEQGSAGYLFNIWCFAFPHCRWALWFDLLRRGGHYTPEEADELAAQFLLIQHRDHHAGLLVKPYPECVDNQAASLCLSSLVVGTLFADTPGHGHLARFLREEAALRLEAMIGGMPRSGYSGEGSTYQGLIVAFAVPFLVEMLERMRGRDLFDQPLPPRGTSARDILLMTSRLWMPGGLLLPWDDYGYQFGIAAPLAYLAHRTGDTPMLRLLEHAVNWSRLNIDSAGWGFDHAVWSLVWWPLPEQPAPDVRWAGWASDEVGGALCDPGGRRYALQMWDPTGAMCTRAQVNPNSLILEADGVPLCADGTPDSKRDPLQYPGAVYERNFGAGAFQRMNLSKGCGGSHNAILVDGNEALRPSDRYELSRLEAFDAAAGSITGDVTGLYRDVYADCQRMRRRTRLVQDRFWLVEDLARFAHEHDLTSRWWFRPGVTAVPGGVDLVTPEGERLQMRVLVGSGAAQVRRVDGYPLAPDGCSDRVDYALQGREARWLWLLWPSATRCERERLDRGWRAQPAPRGADRPALEQAAGKSFDLEPGALPWMQADVPVEESWAFAREVAVPADGAWYLRLPRGLGTSTRLWINGEPVEIPGPQERRELLQPFVACPAHARGCARVRVLLCLEYEVGQSGKNDRACSKPDLSAALCVDDPAAVGVRSAAYADGTVTVTTTTGETLAVPHALMP
jgi:hypothetical protein